MNYNKQLGRIIALDLGEKRIGIALSDPTRSLARSLSIIKRRSRAEDFARYQNLANQHSVTLILVGLPLMPDDTDSDMTRWTRAYAADLAQNIAIPVIMWDERETSQRANELLRQQGRHSRKRRKQRVDAVAAALMLQNYLESDETRRLQNQVVISAEIGAELATEPTE